MQDLRRDAGLSMCGQYRYWLVRQWDPDLPMVNFVMLNPSTADASKEDPTIRKCVGFADRWGFGGLWVVNLFAFRSTDPAGLLAAADPVGPGNDSWLRACCEATGATVLAWGSTGGTRVGRLIAARLLEALPLLPPEVSCLGRTKSGAPRHPLMLPYTTPIEKYLLSG
jgi:hypothetical protein